MKTALLMLLAMAATALYAQDTTGVKQKVNELGLRMEFGGAFGGQQDFVGVQLRHFGRNNIGYRLFAGYGNASTWGSNVTPVTQQADTFYRKYPSLTAHLLMAGGGIEGQHPLYKYVYMFAAIEGRIGYGGNNMDTAIEKSIPTPTSYPSPYPYATLVYGATGPYMHMFFYGIATSVGIKAQLSKFTAGLEIPLAFTNEAVLKSNNTDYGSLQLDISFFLNYRF